MMLILHVISYFAVDADRQMKRKTLIIRYEDMALNPMRYVRQVYRFLGEKFTPEIDKKMQDAIAPPKKSFTDSGNEVVTLSWGLKYNASTKPYILIY